MRQELVIHDAKLSARLDKLGRAARQAHDRVRDHAAKAVENMVRAGQALCKARDLCDTDEWDEFLARYFNKKERTAQTYMKLARNWPVLHTIAPPEALTSQRKALRLLNSLALGDEPASPQAGPPRRKRKKAAAIDVPSAGVDLANDERATSLRRMYYDLLGVLSSVTKDLSDVRPGNCFVRSAVDALRRARGEFVARGEKLFPPEATASDVTEIADSEGQPSQNAQDAIAVVTDEIG